MGKQRFVQPETVRLELSDGDWVEVKAQLSYAEQKRLEPGAWAQNIRLPDGSERFVVDYEQLYVRRLATWLARWSFERELSLSSIAGLTRETGAELDTALDDYIAQLEIAKKATAAAAT